MKVYLSIYKSKSLYSYFFVESLHLKKQVCGITAVILMGIWMNHYRKGFAWQENPKLEFNWHPLLMTIGLIFMYGNGMNV